MARTMRAGIQRARPKEANEVDRGDELAVESIADLK
jgi:hypothetical protein